MSGYKPIVISEPCTQNWNTMSVEKQGRFCEHCSKTVIDFTGLTDPQIVALLEQNSGTACGRFDSHQLNRALIAPSKPSKRNKLHEIFAALLLMLTVNEVSADTAPTTAYSFVKPDSNVIKAVPDNADTTTVTTLTGRVINSKNNLPVANAVIENQSRQTTITAGKAGRFQIAASVGDTINVYYPGYESLQFVVADLKFKSCALTAYTIEIAMPVMGTISRSNYNQMPTDSIK